MTKQPALRRNELVEELNKLYRAGRVDELTLRRIQLEAEKLKPVDWVGAHIVLGMLSCLAWNEPEMRKNHELALRMAPADVTALGNYALSLYKLNFFSESCDYWAQAFQVHKDDPNVVEYYIRNSVMAGRVLKARELLGHWKKLCPNKPHVDEQFIEDAAAVMTEKGITDEQAERLQSVVSTALREERAMFQGALHRVVVEEDGSRLVNFELIVGLAPADVVEMNEKVAERVIEELRDGWPPEIVYTFSPYEGQQEKWPLRAASF